MEAEEARLRRELTRTADHSSDFDLNPEVSLPPGQPLRPAAVLVPVWMTEGSARVILTKRSSRLKHHPGQIALPGGKIDATDASPEAAALREAREEIGLQPDLVEVIGRLSSHQTVTGFAVTPVLAIVRGPFLPVPEAGEVDEVFYVPLSHVCTPTQYRIERRLWRGEWRRYYAAPFGPYYIWGATARILRGLAERMAE